jgi:hypothetical protein
VGVVETEGMGAKATINAAMPRTDH